MGTRTECRANGLTGRAHWNCPASSASAAHSNRLGKSLGILAMTDAIRPLIAGNWKMNGLSASMGEFEAMLAGSSGVITKADLLVCPPATLVSAFAAKAKGAKSFTVGAEDCHPKPSGAHTGDISAEMLADAGASAIIVGHSERRADHGETDAIVHQKTEAVWRAGLSAIVCIGETQSQRDAGQTLDICGG